MTTSIDKSAASGAPELTPLQNGSRPRPKRYEMSTAQWAVASAIGVWLTALGVSAVVGMFWAWNIAGRISATTPDVAVTWVGPDFSASATTAAFLLAATAGVAGSVVHIGGLFSCRAGRRTFEASYTWSYLLRPVLAALLAVLVVAAIRAGTISVAGDSSDNATPMLAFLAGGLAGLFTDRVVLKMRKLLGSTSPEKKATEQPLP